MNNTENPGTSSWTRIQSGVRETERLIGQKKYNLAMIKARQTLEFMVKCLCERTGAMDGSLIDLIDGLYEEQIISKTTFEHYHKIRTIGNKAIHEEDNSAYNANQAYHLLSQEVHTFANDHNSHGDYRRRPASSSSARSMHASSQRRGAPPGRSGSNYSHRRRAHSSGPSFDLRSLIKPLLLIAIIVVLIFIIMMLRPPKTDVTDVTTLPQTEESTGLTESQGTSESTAPATTAAPSTAAVVKYKTNDTVNLRSTPDTTKDRVGVLPPDTTVEYIEGSDTKDSTGKTWCKIKHNGQEAYMVKDYLTPVS